jgi:hypothetical protein
MEEISEWDRSRDVGGLVFAMGNLWVKTHGPKPIPICTQTLTPRVWVCHAMGMGTPRVIYLWVGVDILIIGLVAEIHYTM